MVSSRSSLCEMRSMESFYGRISKNDGNCQTGRREGRIIHYPVGQYQHPLYAGSYVYGRRQEDPRRKQPERPRTGRVVMTMNEWLVHLPNCCPAYISPEQYERN